MQLKTFLAVSLLFCCVLTMNAQDAMDVLTPKGGYSTTDLPVIDGDNMTFYLDTDSKVYYIDFETISVNLSDIKVMNSSGEVVLKDELWDLPVNTIYELDFTDLKSGTYQIELRSFTGMIKKEVTISE